MARHKIQDYPNVFISYAGHDAPFVRQMASALKAKGLNAWYDRSASPGIDWTSQVENALEKSSIFLFIVSPQALTSHQVNFELGVALSKVSDSPDAQIIPVLIERVKPDLLPAPLRSAAMVDAVNSSPGEVAAKLVEAIRVH